MCERRSAGCRGSAERSNGQIQRACPGKMTCSGSLIPGSWPKAGDEQRAERCTVLVVKRPPAPLYSLPGPTGPLAGRLSREPLTGRRVWVRSLPPSSSEARRCRGNEGDVDQTSESRGMVAGDTSERPMRPGSPSSGGRGMGRKPEKAPWKNAVLAASSGFVSASATMRSVGQWATRQPLVAHGASGNARRGAACEE